MTVFEMFNFGQGSDLNRLWELLTVTQTL